MRIDTASLPPPVFEMRVRVYYEDTDAGGIVYHANWLRYFERARSDWLRSIGAVHREMAQDHGVQMVVRDLFIDYRLPARLDDELRIDVRVLEARRASMRLAQTACSLPQGQLLVCTEMRVAAVSVQGQRPAPLPRWLFERMATLSATDPAAPARSSTPDT